MNAQDLEKAILREAEGGPTEVVEIPYYEVPDDENGHGYRALNEEESLERFQKENPNADVHDEFDDGSDPYAVVPIDPCPGWATMYLCVDELRQNYGGPEEGGWWYDSGAVLEIETVRVSFREDRSPYLEDGERAFLGKLAEKWAKDYAFGTHYRSSTRPRGQDYSWRVEWELPKDWPTNRPYYE